MSAAGYVLAAGAIEVANEALGATSVANFNWRIVPATAIMAVALTGIDKMAPGFGNGLGILVLLSVLVIPYGNAPTPLENAAKIMGYGGKVA